MIVAKVKPGTITTIAGNGEPGYFGDNGPAIEACLNEPKSLALDGKCQLYIADAENHVVRKVDLATGVITTVAGRPVQGNATSGSGRPSDFPPTEDEDPLADPSSAKSEKFVQVADVSGTVRYVVGAADKAGRFGGDGGPATHALLNFPGAVAVDRQGHLYIADTMNHRIRKVDAATGIMTTIAGTGQHRFSGDGGPATAAALNEPSALVVDAQDRLYVADQGNNRVRCIDLNTGIIDTFAGTGESGYTGDGMQAREAGLAAPSGLALGLDALYVADTFSGRIRRIDLEKGHITTVAGDGAEYRFSGVPNEFSTSLSRPYGIALDRADNLLITDSDSHLIRRWDRKKKIITRVAGSGQAQFGGDGGDPLHSSLNYPFGIVVDEAGNVYIADTFNHRVRMIAA